MVLIQECFYCKRQYGAIKKSSICCSQQCYADLKYRRFIEFWKKGEMSGGRKGGNVSAYVRRYLHEKYSMSCSNCRWNKRNPWNNACHLEVDHINGDSENNTENNLRLLCPNCHSLTQTYKSLNRGKDRTTLKRMRDINAK